MHAHRTKAIVAENGCLTVEKLPFPAGKSVEVIVFPVNDESPPEKRYPLRGTPLQFDDPTVPVAEADWEILS
jgi:hypothetical protein